MENGRECGARERCEVREARPPSPNQQNDEDESGLDVEVFEAAELGPAPFDDLGTRHRESFGEVAPVLDSVRVQEAHRDRAGGEPKETVAEEEERADDEAAMEVRPDRDERQEREAPLSSLQDEDGEREEKKR